MSSERTTTVNRNNGRRSSGPRTKAGKTRASRNALQHGLAAISHDQSVRSSKIAHFANAICGDDSDPALLAQAEVIAQKEMVLRAIREQQIALVERLRDPTAIALTKRDNSLKLAKARSLQARAAAEEITLRLPRVLEKYRDRLQGSRIPEHQIHAQPAGDASKVRRAMTRSAAHPDTTVKCILYYIISILIVSWQNMAVIARADDG